MSSFAFPSPPGLDRAVFFAPSLTGPSFELSASFNGSPGNINSGYDLLAFLLGAILILFALASLPLFAYPLARAFSSALAASRDPSIRAAPDGPGLMFRRRFIASIRWWLLGLWIVGFVLLDYGGLMLFTGGNTTRRTGVINHMALAFSAATFWLILAAEMIALAPYINSRLGLAAASWLLALLLFTGVEGCNLVINVTAPKVFVWHFHHPPQPPLTLYVFPWIELFGIGVPALWLALRRARSLGERWFRFGD